MSLSNAFEIYNDLVQFYYSLLTLVDFTLFMVIDDKILSSIMVMMTENMNLNTGLARRSQDWGM